jgi:hypothetical protein
MIARYTRPEITKTEEVVSERAGSTFSQLSLSVSCLCFMELLCLAE